MAWLAAACLSACAPALSSFTPAEVADPGHVQAELGIDVSVPTNALSGLVDAGEALSSGASRQPLTDAELERLLVAAWAYALNPPTILPHAGLAVGVADGWEVGGRLVPGGWRVAGRHQVLRAHDHGVDLSTGLGLGHTSYDLDTYDVLNLVDFDDFSRWQLDVPLLVGTEGSWYRWWGGPRILLSSYRVGARVELPAVGSDFDGQEVSADFKGTSAHLGGQLGGALGYRHLFLAMELTVVRFGARATLSSNAPNVGSFTAGAAGMVVYPGVALMGDF